MPLHDDTVAYNKSQEGVSQAICEKLASLIDAGLPKAGNKVWHRAPVWFIDGNPIVGYWVRKRGVQLLLWSGQSFSEEGLKPEGKFKAAEVYYTDLDQINADDIARWLEKAEKIQWDYKNIVKRRGELVMLDTSL